MGSLARSPVIFASFHLFLLYCIFSRISDGFFSVHSEGDVGNKRRRRKDKALSESFELRTPHTAPALCVTHVSVAMEKGGKKKKTPKRHLSILCIAINILRSILSESQLRYCMHAVLGQWRRRLLNGRVSCGLKSSVAAFPSPPDHLVGESCH